MACGAFGSCAVTSLTAQNTHGVHGVHPAPIEFLEQQIEGEPVSNNLADAMATLVRIPSAQRGGAKRVTGPDMRRGG